MFVHLTLISIRPSNIHLPYYEFVVCCSRGRCPNEQTARGHLMRCQLPPTTTTTDTRNYGNLASMLRCAIHSLFCFVSNFSIVFCVNFFMITITSMARRAQVEWAASCALFYTKRSAHRTRKLNIWSVIGLDSCDKAIERNASRAHRVSPAK